MNDSALKQLPPVVSSLQKFNRKERFFLVGWALDNPAFTLGESFRTTLRDQLELGVEVPSNAFVAMDFHLEWLFAGLLLAANGGDRGPHSNAPSVAGRNSIPGTATPLSLGNQEDIDLLIAFETEGKTHLLLIEAKGATGFTNEQLGSKVRRLSAIFADPQIATLDLDPRFVIASPREPRGIITSVVFTDLSSAISEAEDRSFAWRLGRQASGSRLGKTLGPTGEFLGRQRVAS
jgi:hypothetical protein